MSDDTLFRAEAFIKHWEGCKLTVYKDAGGRNTVGIGHLVLPEDELDEGDTITQEEADELFDQDFDIAQAAVEKLVKVPLTDNQLIVLVDFTFNLGISNLSSSTLLLKLNAKDYAGACEELPKWNHVNGIVSDGLTNRRNAERALFMQTQP